jgi:hypothetical protein
VIFLFRKFLISLIVLTIVLIFVVPIAATPDDVILDRQVELIVPGEFQIVDNDQDRLGEALQFTVGVKSYRQGEYLVTGDLEGLQNGVWRTIATTVVPFKWSSEANEVTLLFYPSAIRRDKIDGPYRVSISLKDGDWFMPSQIAGYSPVYSWRQFSEEISQVAGEITSSTDAKQAAEIWANMNQIKLGNFIGVDYNYDRWQVDFLDQRNSQVLRFLIDTKGQIRIIDFKK